VVPADRQTVGCEWETIKAMGGGSSSHFSCAYLVAGDIRTVAASLVTRLRAEGFEATCLGNVDSFELAASRGATTVQAALFPPSSDPEIPSGHVGLQISAAESDEAGDDDLGPPCVAP
jgi:hypothetical protein